ncbi:MAG: hypothetical protein QJR13_04380 [Bacillota bacterium]|nr:hypothetical protein [Bacillota bacterium]
MNEGARNEEIVAVVTTDRELVAAGGVPVFYARDVRERDAIALVLARTTRSTAHELPTGVLILVRRH